MRLLIFVCLLFLSHLAVSNTLYKCIVDGRVNFTDKPCDGERLQLKAMNSLPAVNNEFHYSSNKWFINAKGYREAIRVSQQYKVPMFVYFEAEWCGYCRKLEKELLNTSAGRLALKPVIKVRIRPDDGDKEKALFKKMGATGYPTIFKQEANTSSPQRISLTRKVNQQWQTISAKELMLIIKKWLV